MTSEKRLSGSLALVPSRGSRLIVLLVILHVRWLGDAQLEPANKWPRVQYHQDEEEEAGKRPREDARQPVG